MITKSTRYTRLLTACAISIAVFSFFPVAHAGDKQDKHENCEHHQKGKHHYGSHHRGGMWRIFKELDLSEAQRDSIKSIMSQTREKTAGQQMALREKEDAIKMQIVNSGFDESTIRALAAEKAAIQIELTVLRTQSMSEIRAILTPEQRTKLDEKHQPRCDMKKKAPFSLLHD